MGGNLSTPSSSPSSSNPSAATSATMPPPSNPQSEPAPVPESVPVAAESSNPPPPAPESIPGAQESWDPTESSEPKEAADADAAEAVAAGEEEEECGFCLFMKAGGCKEEFTAWEKCVEEGDRDKEDIVEKCFELTSNLKKCMEAHPEYYGPLLEAEKVAHERARKEYEEEEAAADAGNDGAAAEVKSEGEKSQEGS